MNELGFKSEPKPLEKRLALTMLFSDLCGSTGIAAGLEPEEYSEFLQTLHKLFMDIVPKYGGTVVRIDGDGALCIFGYPTSLSNPAKCAIDAALELHRTVVKSKWAFVKTDTPVRLHTGINSGVVLLREGDLIRGRFEVFGDPTNIAAHMCDHAGPDEIIVSENTLGADQKHYNIAKAKPLEVVGRATKIKVVRVLAQKQSLKTMQSSILTPTSEFIGRTSELDQLITWSKAPTLLQTMPILIHGPAGIGKSRLVNELMSRSNSDEVIFVHGTCDAQIGSLPLQPFLQIYDQAIQLGEPLDLRGDKSLNTIELVTDFCKVLSRHARGKICVCVIEDWHWASSASKQFLGAVLSRLNGQVRFLLTSRGSDLDLFSPNGFRALEVPTWSRDEVMSAVFGILKDNNSSFKKWLEVTSGGNPLFLEELCYGIQRGEFEETTTSKSAWLETLIQSRLSQLSPAHITLLQSAAILGRVVPIWLLEAILNTELDIATLEPLCAADFMYSGELLGTVRFKHGITRDAVYNVIGSRRRKQLHSQALAALIEAVQIDGENVHLDALAYHSFASGQSEVALGYAMKAGELALASKNLDRAQMHFKNAFQLSGITSDQAQAIQFLWPILNKYGLACTFMPHPSQFPILISMVDALAAVGSSWQKARGEFWLGTLNYGLGRGRTAVRYFRRALAIAEVVQEPRLTQQIEVRLANALFAAGVIEEAEARFEKFFGEVGSGFQSTDSEGLSYAIASYEMMLVWRGYVRVPPNVAKLKASIPILERTPIHINLLFARARNALIIGDWELSNDIVLRGLEMVQDLQMPYQIKCAQAWLAIGQWKVTQDPVHLEALENAALWFENGNSMQRTSFTYALAAEIFEEAGDVKKTRKFAARAIARSRSSGDAIGESAAYRTMAILNAKLKRFNRSESYLAKANSVARRMVSKRDSAFNHLAEAQIAIIASSIHNAQALLESAKAEFQQMEMPYFVGRADALIRSIRRSSQS